MYIFVFEILRCPWRLQLIAMGQRRILLLLGLLVLLQSQRLGAHNDDKDCPPGSLLSTGNCILSKLANVFVSFSPYYSVS
jgi:hypothetical protein